MLGIMTNNINFAIKVNFSIKVNLLIKLTHSSDGGLNPPEFPLPLSNYLPLNPENPTPPWIWMGKFFICLHIFVSPVNKTVFLTIA